MKIPGACAHIASLKTVAPAKRRECEECVKTGSEWVHLRTCQNLRRNALLRFLAAPARQPAREGLGPSRHRVDYRGAMGIAACAGRTDHRRGHYDASVRAHVN